MKSIVAKVGLMLASLLVVFAVGEGIARLAGAGLPAELDRNFDRSSTYYRPERRAVEEGEAEPGVRPLKIAVVGDSFTVGQSVQIYDRFASRLEWMLNLNAKPRPVEVQIFAQRGLATVNQIAFLRRALRWEADLVILAIFLNDPETFKDEERLAWRRRIRPRPVSGWKQAVLQRSRLLGWAYQKAEKLRAERAGLRYMQRLYEPDFIGWQEFERALSVFRRVTRQAGVPLEVVIFPAMGLLEQGYPLANLHDRLHGALAAQEIPYLDLLPEFAGKSSARIAAYPGIDAHPSEIGHRIAAEAIFEHLLERGLVGPEYRPRRAKVDPVERWEEEVRRRRSVVWSKPPERGRKPPKAADDGD